MVIPAGLAVWLTVTVMGQRLGPKVSRGKEKWQKFFIWSSWVGAAMASVALLDSTFGDWIGKVSGAHVLLAWPPVIIMLYHILKDIGADSEPNGKACTFTVLILSWAQGLGGGLGDVLHNIATFLGDIQGPLNTNLFGA